MSDGTVNVKIDLDKFDKLARPELVKGLTRAGIYMVSRYRGYVNRAQPYKRFDRGRRYRGLDPSKPGEYPKKLSGQLQKSITWHLDTQNLVLSVGSSLKGYPKYLQTGSRFMQPRPWLTLGFEAEKDKLAKLIVGK